MGLIEDFSKDAEIAIDNARDALEKFADGFATGKGSLPYRLTVMKNRMDWREQFLICDSKKNIAYAGFPEKKTRTVKINSRTGVPAAELSFSKKHAFKEGLGVHIRIFEPAFSFEMIVRTKGILFSVDDFSIISVKDNQLSVKDGDTDAVEVFKRFGNFTAVCYDPKYEFLAAALSVALYIGSKW